MLENKFNKVSYTVVQSTIVENIGALTASMQLNNSCETVYLAENLILTMNFYVGGYLRVQIDDLAFPRFKL
jgi:hypothetical protein